MESLSRVELKGVFELAWVTIKSPSFSAASSSSVNGVQITFITYTFDGLSGPDRPDQFQIGSVQVQQKRLAPVLFIELNAWGRCIG